jgi:hypothetical protein
MLTSLLSIGGDMPHKSYEVINVQFIIISFIFFAQFYKQVVRFELNYNYKII